METKSDIMSPVSVLLSGDHQQHALSDVKPKHSSKVFSFGQELPTRHYKVWKVENDKEIVKLEREIPSPSLKREKSITLKEYDEGKHSQ